MTETDISKERYDAVVNFLREAAVYFDTRATNGEDMAHWANVFNAANCTKAAALVTALRARVDDAHPMTDAPTVSDEMVEAGMHAINGSYCAGQTLCPDKHSQLCGCRRLARSVLEAAIPIAVAAERERAKAIFAKWRDPNHMQLHAGEMTAQEKRSVVAVLRAVETEIAAAIRSDTGGDGTAEPEPGDER